MTWCSACFYPHHAISGVITSLNFAGTLDALFYCYIPGLLFMDFSLAVNGSHVNGEGVLYREVLATLPQLLPGLLLQY